jgi:co-chaperonin GroES (HSP10)
MTTDASDVPGLGQCTKPNQLAHHMNIKRVLGNRVILKPLPQAQQSAGGIAYPQQYRDDNKTFEVIAVGPGEWVRNKKKKLVFKPMEVKPGDKVLADLYSDHTILDDGTRIARADYIQAVW